MAAALDRRQHEVPSAEVLVDQRGPRQGSPDDVPDFHGLNLHGCNSYPITRVKRHSFFLNVEIHL